MNIEPISRFATLSPADVRRLADAWRVGAILAARVVGQGGDGRLLLNVDGREVETETPPDPRLPQSFRVRVAATQPTVVLDVVEDTAEPALAASLRGLLPRQLGLPAMLGDLVALARHPQARDLPPDLRSALAALEAAIPTADDVAGGESLRQVVRHSGLFLEGQLLQQVRSGAPAPPMLGDWKAALARLAATLARHAPPQPAAPRAADAPPPLRQRPLHAQVRLDPPDDAGTPVETVLGRMNTHARGALARVEIAQLEAHPDAQAPAWMIELPVRGEHGTDVLQLRIRRDRDAHDPAAPAPTPVWNVAFAVDLPALGAVHGEVRVQAKRVGVTLWAEHAATARRLDAGLPALAARLGAEGLVADHLACHHGRPQPVEVARSGLLDATA
ncbi:MAG TPA: flagellar hook-length control protein FliK [Mizugakiibacter sp.]